jgi:hypothetical protein
MNPVPRDVIDADVRKVITMARELAALTGPGELAAHTGSDPADVLGAYAAAFGEAKTLLRSLADVTEGLMDRTERRRAFRESLRTGGCEDGDGDPA